MNDPPPASLPPPPPHPVPTPPVAVSPTPPGRPPQVRRSRSGCLLPVILVVLFGSLLANVVLAAILLLDWTEPFESGSGSLRERVLFGDRSATDKVAVI